MLKKINKVQLCIALLLLFTLGGGLVGCSKKNIDVAGKDEKVIVNLAGGSDCGYPSIYTHFTRGPGSFKMELVFDSLLCRGEEGLLPWLAKEWTVSPDGKTYTFVLRDNVKWHDGQDMTAEDVKFTFEYFAENPPVRNDLILDGQPFVKSVKVLNKFTVEVTVEEALATVLDRLGAARIIPKHVWEKVKEPEKYQGADLGVGCGPYVITQYNKEQGLYKFEAFAQYWGPKPLVDVLQFVPVPSGNALLSFENGDIDYTSITPDVLSKYENHKDYTVMRNHAVWGYRLLLNLEKRPELKDKDIRLALVYAIDREELVEKVSRGAGVVGSMGYLPPAHIWYNPGVKEYDFNLNKAKALLNGKHYSITLTCANSNAELRIAELMKMSLAKIGIDLEIKSMDSKSRDAALKNGNYEIALNGTGGLGNDADILRAVYNSVQVKDGGISATGIPGYNNDTINKLSVEQLYELNEEKRKEIIFSLQKIISEEVPLIPLYYTADYVVYRHAKYDGWRYMFDHHEATHGKISFLDMDSYGKK